MKQIPEHRTNTDTSKKHASNKGKGMGEWTPFVFMIAALAIGFILGYNEADSKVKREAIKNGVAHYVIVKPEDPKSEFQWITNNTTGEIFIPSTNDRCIKY